MNIASPPVLAVSSLSKSFGGFRALVSIDLEVAQGERLGIIGPNGSGKTTLMNCISGALSPDEGHVLLGGVDITSMASNRRARLGIARSFQLPRPFHSMTVAENLLVPLRYARAVGLSDTTSEQTAAELLVEFELDGHASRRPVQLSQVQLRKLELARALAAAPRLLICDEAMAGLSSSEVDQVLAIIDRVSARGVTVIMIEHIMRAITSFSQRLICLQGGRLIAQGTVDEVLSNNEVRSAYLGT
jgi:branched-chain amino acid transport system ATP-binding protein